MKKIDGYENYFINKAGQVFKKNKNGELKERKAILHNRTGYYYVQLSKNNKKKHHSIHRLLAQTFLSDYSDDLEVDHIDRNRQNNNLSNLRMVSHQQNNFNRSNAKGYYWDKKNNKWRADIRINSKTINLGRFDTESEARAAYLAAKEKHHIIGEI